MQNSEPFDTGHRACLCELEKNRLRSDEGMSPPLNLDIERVIIDIFLKGICTRHLPLKQATNTPSNMQKNLESCSGKIRENAAFSAA